MKTKNQIQQFHNDEFGSLDIFMVDDKPYFPAKECAKVLGYRDTTNAIKQHCRSVVKCHRPHPQSPGKKIEMNFIPEGDLYRLIIRSKLPAAERFESWVFDEVLPTIRKHGAYATHDTLDELLRSPKFAETLIKRLEKEREKNNALEGLTSKMAPKALYCDMVLQCKNVVPVSLIAKDYGMSGAAFNAMLFDFGIQYPTGGTWLLYQKYARKGYTHTRTYRISENTAAIHTCWTQKGRLFLYEFLKDFGIYPLLESHFVEPFPA